MDDDRDPLEEKDPENITLPDDPALLEEELPSVEEEEEDEFGTGEEEEEDEY